MNIKLHTPKSLKAGSGMASLKQFLLSLLATTVSIALTFGTAAIVDYNKKQKEKHEIVMMVMYDMYTSLKSMEEADSTLNQSMLLQLQLAEDTTKFEKIWIEMAAQMPEVHYTETTEHIFSSSIETINTVGNVLFTENVAAFYQTRQEYKEMVCDALNRQMDNNLLKSIKGALDLDYKTPAVASCGLLLTMQDLFSECQRMMDISDEELEAYLQERQQMEESKSGKQEKIISNMQQVMKLQNDIDNAKSKIEW